MDKKHFSQKSLIVLSDKEMQTLEAYFDGELSGGRELKILQSLREQGICLQVEEDLQELKNSVRSWSARQCLDEGGNKRNVDIWELIEDEVEGIAADRRKRSGIFSLPSLPQAFSRFGFSGAGETRLWLGGVGVGALASLLLALTFVSVWDFGQPGSSEQRPGSSSLMAKVETGNAKRVHIMDIPEGIQRVAVSEGSRRPLEVPSDTFLAYQEHFRMREEKIKREMFAHFAQIMDRDFVTGGLRTPGADIDWIKSDNEVRLVRSRSHSSPPIIWVNKSRAGGPIDISNLD